VQLVPSVGTVQDNVVPVVVVPEALTVSAPGAEAQAGLVVVTLTVLLFVAPSALVAVT
jgi:hypothetical protein